MRKFGLVIAAAAMVAFAGSALASSHNSGPSSKASFTHADVNIVQEIDVDALSVRIEIIGDGIGNDDGVCDQDEFDAGGCTIDTLDALSTGKWSVLQTTIKMPKHKDISIDVSFECGNFLDTHVKSKGGQKDSASAAATVRVAVMVDDGFNTPTFAAPSTPSALGADLTGDGNADGDDDLIAVLSSGVVFCHKSQLLEATFQGLIQTGDEEPGFVVTVDGNAPNPEILNIVFGTLADCQNAGDGGNTCEEVTVIGTCLILHDDGRIVLLVDCLTPEELRLVTGSMTANAFNFLYHNALRSSVHTITVIAWLDTGAALGGTALGSAGAKAAIGLGSMQVETIRLIRGADITSDAPVCLDGACL